MKERSQKKVNVNHADFEIKYAKKLNQIEEKKKKLAEEHAIKKKAEEEKLHTFKPNLSRKDRSRSRNRSEIDDISASKSPNDDSARRSISKNVKMQQN